MSILYQHLNFKNLLFLFFILLTAPIMAQGYQTVEEIDTTCAEQGLTGDEAAERAVNNILDKMGLFSNFIIQECPNINNAIAKNIDIGEGNKERYILYDAEFFSRIEEKASNDWAATSILAHEIGHHLNGHALNDEGSSHKWELEADEFSGFALARMGSTIEDAQSAIMTLKNEEATSTHPAKKDRIKAIEKGWNRGMGNINDGDEMTANRVLQNYINAIGGEENIKKLKTIKKIYRYDDNVVMNINGTKTNSSSKSRHDITHLTPSKYIFQYSSGDMKPSYQLFLDDKLFTKKQSGDWGMTNNAGGMSLVNTKGSYIPELSMLIRNEDVTYLGVHDIEGSSYYKLQLPDVNMESDMGVYTSSQEYIRYNYYSVDTGLLFMSEWDNTIRMEYAAASMKPSETNGHNQTYFLDYTTVNGVLFSLKQLITASNKGPNYESFVETAGVLELLVNINIDKSDFMMNSDEVIDVAIESKDEFKGLKPYTKGLDLIGNDKCDDGFVLIKEAADLGYPAAQDYLGKLYEKEYSDCNIPQDFEKSLYWYTQAADQWNSDSLKKLAKIYEIGEFGAAKDAKRAVELYFKACREFMIADYFTLKSIKKLKKEVDLTEGEQLFVNSLIEYSNNKDEKGFELLKQSAENNCVNAQVALATKYLIKSDNENRVKWLQKAIELGDSQAIKLLEKF